MVKTVRKSEEFYATISSGKLVVCEWFAHWCLPCKSMAPVAEDLAAEFALTEFIKLDIDEAEVCVYVLQCAFQIRHLNIKDVGACDYMWCHSSTNIPNLPFWC
eukprot:Colp12_sorted_trinity150504_noHs@26666